MDLNPYFPFLNQSIKFGMEDPHVMPLSSCEFHENQCNGSYILLKGINELWVLSIFGLICVKFRIVTQKIE